MWYKSIAPPESSAARCPTLFIALVPRFVSQLAGCSDDNLLILLGKVAKILASDWNRTTSRKPHEYWVGLGIVWSDTNKNTNRLNHCGPVSAGGRDSYPTVAGRQLPPASRLW
jgi:hypothetical protein